MLRFTDIETGMAVPERSYRPTHGSLCLYNAAIWNAHRIHYDETYTRDVEKHPAIVVDGPLQGDWLTQAVLNWMGDDGILVEFEYSNRRATYLGDTLVSGGKVERVNTETREA